MVSTLQLWSIMSGEVVCEKMHTSGNSVKCVAFNFGGRDVMFMRGSHFYIFDTQTFRCRSDGWYKYGDVFTVSPTTSMVIEGGKRSIKLISTSTRGVLRTIDGSLADGTMSSVAFGTNTIMSNCGMYIATASSFAMTIAVWTI